MRRLFCLADPRLMSDLDLARERNVVDLMLTLDGTPPARFEGVELAYRLSLLCLRREMQTIAFAVRRGKRPSPDDTFLSFQHSQALDKYETQTVAYGQVQVTYMDQWFRLLAVKCGFPFVRPDTPWEFRGVSLPVYREQHGKNALYWNEP